MIERRLESLDGLRGISIIAVLLSHSAVFVGFKPELFRAYRPLVEGGALGVDIFFVLSGFLITSALLRMHAESGRISLRTFFLNRATRLLPALYVMLAVYSLIHVAHGMAFGDFEPTIRSAILYVVNWQTILGWGPIQFDLVPLWSLSTEEQFYLVWPLVMIGLLRYRRRVALAVICGMWAVAIAWRLHYVSGHGPFDVARLDLRCDGLLIGSAAALIHSRRALSTSAAHWMVATGSFVIGVHLAFAELLTMYMGKFGLALFNLATAMLALGLVNSHGYAHGVLQWRPLTAIGRVSYGIYLWHLPVWFYFMKYHGSWSLPVLVSVSTGMVALITIVSWRYVEQPAMRLRRHWLPSAGDSATRGHAGELTH